eukprot:CAMPEP_0171877206 /NCGR_PEP_ID=MMETSP0992-20121227/36557_1 /TAXON_ID=483369 /ORGANISM="non described non described, Strain CCMP2098" /LENGTH=80 /DNA_ID=CAMNT_0012502409 /DNA_START=31 /DNA_END=269 /DNA_ORIENTATION=-
MSICSHHTVNVSTFAYSSAAFWGISRLSDKKYLASRSSRTSSGAKFTSKCPPWCLVGGCRTSSGSVNLMWNVAMQSRRHS